MLFIFDDFYNRSQAVSIVVYLFFVVHSFKKNNRDFLNSVELQGSVSSKGKFQKAFLLGLNSPSSSIATCSRIRVFPAVRENAPYDPPLAW